MAVPLARSISRVCVAAYCGWLTNTMVSKIQYPCGSAVACMSAKPTMRDRLSRRLWRSQGDCSCQCERRRAQASRRLRGSRSNRA